MQRMDKWASFYDVMILKEERLIVTGNIISSLEILKQKLELKQKEDFKSTRAFGIGERDERWHRLIEFVEENKLIIANTLFQKSREKKNRYWA